MSAALKRAWIAGGGFMAGSFIVSLVGLALPAMQVIGALLGVVAFVWIIGACLMWVDEAHE
jgi:hypothetical protein